MVQKGVPGRARLDRERSQSAIVGQFQARAKRQAAQFQQIDLPAKWPQIGVGAAKYWAVASSVGKSKLANLGDRGIESAAREPVAQMPGKHRLEFGPDRSNHLRTVGHADVLQRRRTDQPQPFVLSLGQDGRRRRLLEADGVKARLRQIRQRLASIGKDPREEWMAIDEQH